MNRTSRTVRLLCAAAAVATTGTLFQAVASFAQPTALEQMARARAEAVTVAGIGASPSVATRGIAR